LLLPYHTPDKLEAGTDEAGRGCLAGPVFAAAVILPRDFTHPFLRDSKQLNSIQKEELYEYIKQTAISYSIKKVPPAKIDQINILNASILAMHKSLAALKPKPESRRYLSSASSKVMINITLSQQLPSSPK